jgi:hypothetical protein
MAGNDLEIDGSGYEILHIQGISPLDKTPGNDLFTNIQNNEWQ